MEVKSDNEAPFKHELHILYVALEYPRNYTSNLAEKFNNNALASGEPTTFKPCLEERESREYHLTVENLLETYLKELSLNPDVIVVGEYTPLFFGSSSLLSKYRIVGFVDTTIKNGKADGRRAMTVLVREDTKTVHRITVHDGRDNPTDHWISEKAKEKRMSKDGYKDRRKSMKQKWQKATKTIGACIEIMYKNRYIAAAHVPNGRGKDAPINKVKATLQDLCHASIIGDLNCSVNTKNHSHKEEISNTHTLVIHTDVGPLLGLNNTAYEQAQRSNNDPGKTTYSVGHDGACILNDKHGRTDNKIVGSAWPIIIEPNNGSLSNPLLISIPPSNQFLVIGDHKGFLFKVTTSSRHKDGVETDTEVVTDNESKTKRLKSS